MTFSQTVRGAAHDANEIGMGSMTIVRDEKYQTRYERGRVKVIESLLPKGTGQPALDLGCGSGYSSRMLTDRGGVVTAVDAESENIQATERYAYRGIVGVLPEALDLLEGERFGFVLALELIEHLDVNDGKILLEKILRLTAEGGDLLISTPNRLSIEGLSGYYWGRENTWLGQVDCLG